MPVTKMLSLHPNPAQGTVLYQFVSVHMRLQVIDDFDTGL